MKSKALSRAYDADELTENHHASRCLSFKRGSGRAASDEAIRRGIHFGGNRGGAEEASSDFLLSHSRRIVGDGGPSHRWHRTALPQIRRRLWRRHSSQLGRDAVSRERRHSLAFPPREGCSSVCLCVCLLLVSSDDDIRST